MQRSLASAVAVIGGGALGCAVKRRQERRTLSTGNTAMRRLTSYFIVPIWIGAGFLDYIWHKRTRIETTSGLGESLMHSLMMIEAAPAVLSALFLEVNAGTLASMIGFSLVHELTVLWDLSFTAPRRIISAGEQVTHTFLEAPPFLVTAAAISTHWDQFLALLGRGTERPRFNITLQEPAIRTSHVLLILTALTLLGALPHADELQRCIKAKAEGRIGQDTPKCLQEVFQ